MSRVTPATVTLLLFVAFLLAGAAALAAAAVIMGALIVDASQGDAGALGVIAAGAMTGTLASFIVHEITMAAPGVVRDLSRRRI